MKKIAALLALVLCLMTAATAMADPTPVSGKYDKYAASENGYYVKLQELEGNINDDIGSSVRPDSVIPGFIEYLKDKLGTDNFKVMYYDAEAYAQDDRPLNVGTYFDNDNNPNVDSVTVEFDSAFFGGDQIKKILVVYHDGRRNGVRGVREYEVTNNTTSVKVKFNHMTPIAFAWIPEETPVAAPLEAPDMPSTGDDGNLAMLFVLLGVSVAALGAMKLRRREN